MTARGRALFLKFRMNLDELERVAPQVQKKLSAGVTSRFKHLPPDPGNRSFQFRESGARIGGDRVVGAPALFGRGQGRAIDLAVRRERQRVDFDEVGGDHVCR